MSFSDEHPDDLDQHDALGWLDACLTVLVPAALATIALMATGFSIFPRILW